MTTDLDRRRLAAAAELERFEADERRRLAYADRAGTLERKEATLDRRHEMDGCGACGHAQAFHAVGSGNGVPYGHGYCDDRHGDPCDCTGFQRRLADGTGRHSRKEMEQATVTAENAAAQRVEDAADSGNDALDALERLVCAFPELDRSLATMPQQRAWRNAKLVLVEAGRKVRS